MGAEKEREGRGMGEEDEGHEMTHTRGKEITGEGDRGWRQQLTFGKTRVMFGWRGWEHLVECGKANSKAVVARTEDDGRLRNAMVKGLRRR